MSAILGLEKIKELLNDVELEQLERAAALHSSQSNIEFCILEATEKTVQIETTQLETKSKKYATEATLVKRTKEVFEKRMPEIKLLVQTVPFLISPASVVNPNWIEKKMEEKGVRIKQIAFETGIDRESIADWISGKRSMSQIVKALFYYYLTK